MQLNWNLHSLHKTALQSNMKINIASGNAGKCWFTKENHIDLWSASVAEPFRSVCSKKPELIEWAADVLIIQVKQNNGFQLIFIPSRNFIEIQLILGHWENIEV